MECPLIYAQRNKLYDSFYQTTGKSAQSLNDLLGATIAQKKIKLSDYIKFAKCLHLFACEIKDAHQIKI